MSPVLAPILLLLTTGGVGESRRTRKLRRSWAAAALMFVLSPLSAVGQSYGYLRTVEGTVDLLQGAPQVAVEATANYPLQAGDQIRVGPVGRLEAVLPDASLLRIDGNSELRFGRISGSLDSDDTDTLVHLLQGNVQIAPAAGLMVSRTEIAEFVEEIEETVNITEADIIVSGGRGLGKAASRMWMAIASAAKPAIRRSSRLALVRA